MRLASLPLLLYGLLMGLGGFLAFAAGAGADLAARAVADTSPPLAGAVYLWSGCVVWAGAVLAALDLFILLPAKRHDRRVVWNPPANPRLTVVLTAYNDEESIGPAVRDFAAHPLVERVIVVDNSSSDATVREAERAGAVVVTEERRGYGWCVYRCLEEGCRQQDTELTLLCEGDMTFRAYDIDKFMSYIPHAEIINGTRIVEQLRERKTQLTTFMYYGNFTDVGTTYKLCRNESLRRLLPLLNPAVNLEFNAHFLDVALHHGFHIVECPVTFHDRVGKSKGGNRSNWSAVKVGLGMIGGLIFGWPAHKR
jgi:glycosyltransferase involved in cell wall biosynthesis